MVRKCRNPYIYNHAHSMFHRWSFIPKSLVEQFRKISNLYFLLVRIPQFRYHFFLIVFLLNQILCVQLIPGISPIVPLASILPLAFVVGVAMLKEAVEDYVSKMSPQFKQTKLSTMLSGNLFCFSLIFNVFLLTATSQSRPGSERKEISGENTRSRR